MKSWSGWPRRGPFQKDCREYYADKIAELKASEKADKEKPADLAQIVWQGFPVELGQHLWQWNGDEIREWVINRINAYHNGEITIECLDIEDGDYGNDYEAFDAACIGHKLKLTCEDAEAEKAKMEDGKC